MRLSKKKMREACISIATQTREEIVREFELDEISNSLEKKRNWNFESLGKEVDEYIVENPNPSPQVKLRLSTQSNDLEN